MDLRTYYAKIRELSDSLKAEFVVVASIQTGDGGRAGVLTEVRRDDAARMVVDSKARLATESEREDYYEQQRAATEQAADSADTGKVHFTVLSEADLKTLRNRLSQTDE